MGLDVAEIGMGSDLSLDLRYFASKAVRQTSKDSPAPDMDAYIRRLEEERGKIEVFRRELPLCARLLADVIDVMKEETEKTKKKDDGKDEEDGAAGDKSKWMSTAQLWTGGSGRDAAETEKQVAPEAAKSCGGAFVPFKAAVGSGTPAFGRPCSRNDANNKAADARMPDLSLLSPPPAIKSAAPAAERQQRQVVGFTQAAARAAAMVAPSGGPAALSLQPQPQQTPQQQQQQQQQQQARKSRRCWSPELHRQFVAALNQLGGPQVATPKQIRELMKVDGLTNDEVKSHLQKYRLHTRRTPGSGGVVSQPIVVVGGLWIPQEQSSSQSGSPHGPLHHLSSTSGIAVSSGAEEEDGRSSEMSYGWK